LLFSGFQAEGTLGRDIINGNPEVNVDGIPVKVKAQIRKIEGLSAHADKSALLNYIDCFKTLPVKVFIVHGERGASLELADAIKEKFRIRTVVPRMNDEFDLAAGEVRERTIVKGISTGTVSLNFENISGKKMALFAGGIIDNGDEYSLVSIRQIEEMLHDLKKDLIKPLHDEIIISEIHIQPETVSSATPPSPEELILDLIKIFKGGYVSKGLIRDLLDASDRGISEYRKVINKKIKNDALILDENDLRRKDIKLPERSLVSGQLEDLLKRSSLMEQSNLQSSLNRVFIEIK
jgi:hypothetical protein